MRILSSQNLIFSLIMANILFHQLVQAQGLVTCNNIAAFVIDTDEKGSNIRLYPSSKEKLVATIPHEYSIHPKTREVKNEDQFTVDVNISGVINSGATSWFYGSAIVPNINNENLKPVWGPQIGYIASHYKSSESTGRTYILGSQIEKSENYWYSTSSDTKKKNKIPKHYDQKSTIVPILDCAGDRIMTILDIPNKQNKLIPTKVWLDKYSLCPNLLTSCS